MEYIFLIINYFDRKICQVIDIVMNNIFYNILHDLKNWVLNNGLVYFTNLTSAINQKPDIMGSWFPAYLQICIETIKIRRKA